MRMKRLLICLLYAMTIFSIVGCQAVFTFAPFGFAADDPAKMPKAQLVTYGWDVIASGDRAKMTAALTAVMSNLASNPNDKDLLYVGANLSLSLSNAMNLFTKQTEIFANHPASIIAFKSTIDQPMLTQAGMLFIAAGSNGIVLNAVDYIFASIGWLLYNGNTLTSMEALVFFPYTTPPPPWGTPDVAGWPNGDVVARALMDQGITILGGYTDANLWWQSIVGCFFGPPL